MSLPSDIPSPHKDPLNTINHKKTLRKQLIEIRQNIPVEEHIRLDRAIGHQVLSYLQKHPFKTIGVYLPIRHEPDLDELYAELSQTIQLALPITLAKDQPLQFVRWQPGDQLIKGAYNVSIPAKQIPVAMPEALLIPCVGFTADCFRLGYGGGFFDRTLAKYPDTHTIGIAYSALLTTFETEKNDIPLRCIITENGVLS